MDGGGMSTTTTTYSFTKPTDGGDDDAWGPMLNANWDAVDDLFDGTTNVTGISITTGTIAIAALPEATTANFLAKTADKLLSTDQTWGAAAFVAVTDGATVTVDMDAAINASVTLAGNRTLSFSNIQEGQGGIIKVTQDATGSRTLTGDTMVVTDSDGFPVLTTTASAVDLLVYFAISGTEVLVAPYRLDVS